MDDSEDMLEVLRRNLTLRGYKTYTVSRAEEAIKMLDSTPIDLVITDLKMPGISGEETLDALKKEHEWMEVIILTGHGSIGSAVECTRNGAYSYLQKPCEFEELLNELANAYKKRMMNKMKLEKERMDEVLGMALSSSPLGILRRLKELDRKGE